MAQGILPVEYEVEGSGKGMTALAGLPIYLELAQVMGVTKSVRERLTARDGTQGWTDVQMVMSIILLNLAGGDCIDDLDRLEKDEGFSTVLRRAELHHLPRSQRRELERRWRKARKRAVPSSSAALRYLDNFHDPAQEALRQDGKAFIPKPNENLRGLSLVNRDLAAFLQSQTPQKEATLDVDATLVPTHKSTALYCYKRYKAYQPLNVWWAEQQIVLHTEFRDGNVPAGYEILRVVAEALEMVPEGITTVSVRSDTAGYQHEFLKFLTDAAMHPRFGEIKFGIGCDVTPSFKRGVADVPEENWKTLYREEVGPDGKKQKIPTKRQWAEVCFVPNGMGYSKKTVPYRFLATRELLDEQPLPGLEDQQQLPFQTMSWASKRYKVFGTVTNRREEEGWTGDRVINWVYERCGKSEEAHSVMKEDLAGGKLPCAEFGKNAAWWWMMILAFNLNTAMKKLALGGNWVTRRLKAIRFHVIQIAGRVLERGNRLKMRVASGLEMLEVIIRARERIAAMAGP